MKNVDRVSDLGPEGGTREGEAVFEGTPNDLLEDETSITAEHLRKSIQQL